MSNKKEELQKIYQKNFPSWEEKLNDISDTISTKLQVEELKFSYKKRVKSLESLNAKKQGLVNNGLNKNQQVKDLLGLRFIVPFLEDVERIVDIIKESFDVVDIERKSEALSYREFAYDSVHMEISLKNLSIELPDICSQSCEIQIRTILQEAWAEIEHELVYKSDIEYPDSRAIRKKMSALNANLVLSDMIFQEIRDKQKELEIWGQERFKELQARAKKVSIDSLPKYLIETKKENWKKQKHSPKNIEINLFKALEAHNNENYRRAIDLYSEALFTDPPLKVRAIIYNHRGLAFFMLNKERQALKDFEDSFKCDPSYYQVLNNRALMLRRMGLTNEALYNFDKSLELKEKQAEVYYLRAQTHYETENYQ
jgi:ppGpp synthetase/RelA/SpoT-type nucleotidyltranferase